MAWGRIQKRTFENLDDYARVIVKSKTYYGERSVSEVKLLLNLPPKHPGDRCAYCGKLMPIDYQHDSNQVDADDEKVQEAPTTEIRYDGTYKLRGYGPFCSTTCAIRFAKAAHKAGYRIVS